MKGGKQPIDTQANLAAKLGQGSDFVSRVLAAERWPDLNSVPDWATALSASTPAMLLAWLRDRAPRAHDALVAELFDRSLAATAPPNPAALDLVNQLAGIPGEPRRALETLIRYLSATDEEDRR
jgi:hypothetical protein